MALDLPGPFVERMRRQLGPEWDSFVAALGQPPQTTIRLHPQKGADLYPDAPRVPWHPLGRILPSRPNFADEPFWHAGAYYVQEASGMSLAVFLPERRPLRVIDLSAAPGGKATLLLSELGFQGGLLIANDPNPARRSALAENLARWGIPAYFVTGRHPHYWARRYPESFDVVVLDAPCSGEGLWRRQPSAISHWHPNQICHLSRLQRNLLYAAMALVAPGGRLIYATCTFAPEENEENLAAVFTHAKGWHPVVWSDPPKAVQEVSYGAGGKGYYFFPHRGPGEGFFISAWQREGTSKPRYEALSWQRQPHWVPLPLRVVERGNTLYALTEAAAQLIPPSWEKETWEAFPLWRYHRPAHAAALLSGAVYTHFPYIALTPETFPAYLRGDTFSLSAEIVWATWEGRGIGWLYKGRPSLAFTWRRFLSR
ncbi:MAG: RsmB/NOP family class I SAM-dependent RNA methyltransferase [Bacteroidia bacterium]